MILILFLFATSLGNIFNLDTSTYAWINLNQEIYLEITPDLANGYAWTITDISSDVLIIKEKSDLLFYKPISVPLITQIFAVLCTEHCKPGDTVRVSMAMTGIDNFLPFEIREIFIQISNQNNFMSKQVVTSYQDINDITHVHLFIANGYVTELIKDEGKWKPGKLNVKGNDVSAISWIDGSVVNIRAFVCDDHQITEWIYGEKGWYAGELVYPGIASSVISWYDKNADKFQRQLYISQYSGKLIEFSWDGAMWKLEGFSFI